MNVRHECPMPDLSFAVTAPLKIQKGDECEALAHRWTLSGLWLDDDEVDVSGDVTLTIPFQGVDVSIPAKLNSTDKADYYTFKDLTVRQRETLAAFHKGVLSGQMVSTKEMITSLDTPVDLVPMGETEAEEAAGCAKEKPRILRVIYNSLFYVIFAILLFALLGNQVWSRLTRIELDHARFSASIVEYKAPESGYVERLYVKVGDVVEAGDILVKIEDPDRESDVEDTRAEATLAERRLRVAKEQLARHKEQYDRVRAQLWAEFYRVWAAWRVNEPRSTRYPIHIQSRWEALYAFDRGRDHGYITYFSTLQMLTDVVGERDLELRRWKRDLRHKKAATNELIVRARRDGTIFSVNTTEDNFVGRNDLLVEIEDQTPRVAVGWLDDSLATEVFLGMPAEISYVYRGQPKRNTGVVVDIQAGTDAARPDTYGVSVTVLADDVGVLNARKWFRRNAPAEIKLKRLQNWNWFGEVQNGGA